MSRQKYPFVVRAIGFSHKETDAIDSAFRVERGDGHGYLRLLEDDLRDPDIYAVNAEDLKALVSLTDLRPSAVRPALLIGSPEVALPYPQLPRPIRRDFLLKTLDSLVEKRADTLSKLDASDVVTVTERRRRDRVDVDLTDPSTYTGMRVQPSDDVGVLVVDKSPLLQSYLIDKFRQHSIPVTWAVDEESALEACTQNNMAVVIINTSTPEVEPYRLCKTIKQTTGLEKNTVIFLVGKSFPYDPIQARAAGAEGFLTKPLGSGHLVGALRKFLPPLWR